MVLLQMKISDIKKLINVDQFFAAVEAAKVEYNCSYLDAIVHCCEQQHIELDMAAALIRANPTMKKKVQQCSHLLRLVKL
jgi:hypothetical protein